ncbi:MAG TPA: lamin tail domain-containing protein [Armatimonadota bacterium]
MIPSRLFKRAATWLAAALALAMALNASAQAASTTVVISQVFGGGGGGTAGTPYKYDFVELYNMSGSDVDITGWSVQYASTGGTSWNPTVLSGSIKAGRYYLVQLGSVGTVGGDLPTPDATGGANLSGSNGKVALVNSSTALTDASFDGAAPVGTGASIVDLVGYGSASRYEGGGAVPALTALTAALRNGTPRGSVDTNVNSADFTVGTADPRNTSWNPAATNPPVVSNVTFNPASVDPGGSSVLSATVTPGTNPTISSVTADLTSLGGSATAAMTLSSGTTYTISVNVPADAAAGAKSVTVTATDAAAKTGTGTGSLSVNTVGGPLTVAQLRAKAVDAVTAYDVRGIVIANSVNANGVYIEDANGAAGVMLFGGVPINAAKPVVGDDITATGTLAYYNGAVEFVVTAVTVNSSGNPVPAAAALTVPQAQEIGPAPTYAHPKEGLLVSLSNLTVVSITTAKQNFLVKDSAGATIQLFINKNSTSTATSPYPGIPANPIDATTIVPGNVYNVTGVLAYFKSGTGSGTDPAGFEIVPRNGDDLSLIGQSVFTSAAVSPTVATRGGQATFTVVTNPVAGSTVTADLSAFGGSAAQALAYDGSASYTYTLNVPGGQPLGPQNISLTASNPGQNGGAPTTTTVTLTVITQPTTMTIAQARAAADFTGVILSGAVTHIAPGPVGTFYLQDATGGAYFFDAKNTPFTGFPGDPYTVQGFKTTYQGGVEIDYTGNKPASGGVAPTITPVNATATQWPAAEGKLASTVNLVIVSTRSAGANKVYEVTDGTAAGEIFISSLNVVGTAGATNATFAAGDLANYIAGSAWTVTGVVDRYTSTTMDAWQIKPNTPADFTSAAAPALVPAALAFTTQPGAGTPGSALSASPVVTVQTSTGATVTTFTGPVTLAIKSGTGATGAALSGTVTVNAVNGVASFGPLNVDLAGTGYALNASSGWLPTATSAAFSVTAPSTPGDIDHNGVVNADDVLLALKVAGGVVAASDPSVSVANGDLDGDSAITILDAVKIKRLL